MTLEEYLRTESAHELAAKLGWSDSKLTRLKKLEQDPTFSDAMALEFATGGKVTANGWFAQIAAKK